MEDAGLGGTWLQITTTKKQGYLPIGEHKKLLGDFHYPYNYKLQVYILIYMHV